MAIFVGYTQKRRTVRLLSAGETIYLLCPPPTIEIQAVLSDITNLRNHTIEWVQVKGNTVVLSNADSLVASFPSTETTDKRFRFYVDRGTNNEQYKDLDIFYTPTTYANGGSRIIYSQEGQTVPNVTKSNGFLIPLNPYVEAPVAITPATIFEFDALDLQDLAGNAVKLEVFQDIAFGPRPSNLYSSYSQGEFPTTLALPPGTYLVKVTYINDAISKTYISPLLVSFPSAVAGADTYVNEIVFRTKSVLNNVSLLKYTPIILNALELLPVPRSNIRNAITVVSTPRFIDYNSYPALNETLPAFSSGFAFSALARSDPSNIGN